MFAKCLGYFFKNMRSIFTSGAKSTDQLTRLYLLLLVVARTLKKLLDMVLRSEASPQLMTHLFSEHRMQHMYHFVNRQTHS